MPGLARYSLDIQLWSALIFPIFFPPIVVMSISVVDFLTPASDISLNIRLTATQTTGLYSIIFVCYLLILDQRH